MKEKHGVLSWGYREERINKLPRGLGDPLVKAHEAAWSRAIKVEPTGRS